MRLGAPTIAGPVSVCNANTGILVQGQRPGADVVILRNGQVIGHDSSPGSSHVVALLPGTTLAVGEELRAAQQFGPDSSPTSAPIWVHDAPSQVTAGQIFTKPLYACAECVWLENLEPGANVTVLAGGGATLGTGRSPTVDTGTDSGTIARIGLSSRVNANERLRVVQDASGTVWTSESPPALDLGFEAGRDVLPPPTVEEPLHHCQPSFLVSDVFEGARVSIRRERPDGTLATSDSCFDSSAVFLRLGEPLSEGEGISADQRFSFCEQWSPFAPEPPVEVDPPVRAGPAVGWPICAGTTSVTVSGLRPDLGCRSTSATAVSRSTTRRGARRAGSTCRLYRAEGRSLLAARSAPSGASRGIACRWSRRQGGRERR